MSSDSAWNETVSCNLCGSRRDRELYNKPYRLSSLAECGTFAATTDEFQNYGRIVRCLDCGLVYTNPRPKQEALLNGYFACEDDTYVSESSSRSVNAHFSVNTIRHFIKSGKLVEIGASTGYFLNAARSDFEVMGLEPSRWASELARKKFKLDVYSETLEETKRLSPNQWDVVVMLDVIEHLTDPKKAIIRAAEVLKPGGYIYLVTPDIGSLSAKILRSYWWGLRPAHIYYFDKNSMKRMLEEAGFEVVLVKSFGRIFTYGYWVSRFKHYPAFIYKPLTWIIRALDIADKLVYVDTRDSMEICARKRP